MRGIRFANLHANPCNTYKQGGYSPHNPLGGTMEYQRPPRSVRHLTNRLQRIEGQVRGIQRMVDDGREATDILMQLSAVLAATRRLAGVITREALEEEIEAAAGQPSERAAAIVDAFSRLD